jgi:hypothetical protein
MQTSRTSLETLVHYDACQSQLDKDEGLAAFLVSPTTLTCYEEGMEARYKPHDLIQDPDGSSTMEEAPRGLQGEVRNVR